MEHLAFRILIFCFVFVTGKIFDVSDPFEYFTRMLLSNVQQSDAKVALGAPKVNETGKWHVQ